jgi:hypothetical protein
MDAVIVGLLGISLAGTVVGSMGNQITNSLVGSLGSMLGGLVTTPSGGTNPGPAPTPGRTRPVATEAEPTTEQPVEAATQPTRGERVKTAFKEQSGHARARIGDWLSGGDLDPVDVIQAATEKKQRKRTASIAQQNRIVAEAHGRLAVAKMRAEAAASRRQRVRSRHTRWPGCRRGVEAGAAQASPVMPPTDREISNVRHRQEGRTRGIPRRGRLRALPVTGAAVEQAVSGQPLILAALGTASGYGWYLVSRPFVDGQPAPAPMEQLAAPVDMVKTEQPGGRDFNAPPPPALTVQQLEEALRKIGEVRATSRSKSSPCRSAIRRATPPSSSTCRRRRTVAELKKKLEEFAGAIGRDSTMVDVEKAGTAVRTSLWITDRGPVRRHPAVAAYQEPLPDRRLEGRCARRLEQARQHDPPADHSSNIAIGGGMTRSGKGVGASNLAVGASFDPRINLRIVAGKNNGEWDAYAKAGVASHVLQARPEPASSPSSTRSSPTRPA